MINARKNANMIYIELYHFPSKEGRINTMF